MKNSYVLGICGHAGAGKDMVADYLVKEFSFVRMAFADPIKEMAHIYFGVPQDQLQRSDKPQNVRWLLQQLGTEIGRTFRADIWTETLCRRIQMSLEPRIVVTDVRFPNEAEALVTGLGADLIQIVRTDNPNNGMNMMQHPSETSIEKIPPVLFHCAFLNVEGKQNDLLHSVAMRVKGQLECHNSQKTPE
jgi:hypothetical protein